MRIGIDMGGTKIEGIALDEHGTELKRLRVPTPRGDYDGSVTTIRQVVEELEEALGLRGTVGVGIPGTIVESTGLVKNANSTWLNGRPFAADLALKLGRPVRCANDANCFTVSEATDGAARDFRTVFGVIAGTGCGGGLVVGGSLHPGRNGLAGEWGHTPLPWLTAEEYPGPPCYCGRRGCLETWISGTGLKTIFLRVTGLALSARDVVKQAGGGDEKSMAALERLAGRMARGLAVIVDIVDPDAILLGRGLSRIDWLYKRLFAEVREHTFGGNTDTPILKAMHGDSSGVRGAAWLWQPEDWKQGRS